MEEAKAAAGIPDGEEPDIQPNIRGGKAVPGSKNLDYLDENGNVVTLRHDYGGHEYPDDPSQDRGPHFNTSDGAHFDYTGRGIPFGPLRQN